MRGNGTAFLCETSLIQHAAALVLEMCCHAEQGTNRHHASAADAGDQDIPGLAQIGFESWHRQHVEIHFRCTAFFLFQSAAFDGDEARAETFHAREIFIAIALIDFALAAEFGLKWKNSDAIRFHAAIAAAFADRRIDESALCRIDHLAALATTTFFGGAGLIKNNNRGAGDFAQTFLHVVELVAMQKFDAARENFRLAPFVDVIAEHDDGLHAFATNLMCDIRHGQCSINRLAAGHCDRIVVQNLVGDVDLRGNRLANRQRTGMEIGTVTQILEHVFFIGKRRLAAPGRAFATHLRKRIGLAIHPGHHVMATDTAKRTRTFRYHGR